MRTHTSYAVSKRLKEFMGEGVLEPMKPKYWSKGPYGLPGTLSKFQSCNMDSFPAYQLHDLLSRPFCEAFVKVGAKKFGFDEDEITDFVADWSTDMAYAYWNGGLEAVEAALMKMMDGEGA